ncbi:MAG: hypothetical protein ACE5FY_04665 [Nitrospiria bacterium]
MRTTMTVDDEIMAKLQDRAKQTGKPFKEIVNDALRIGLFYQDDLAKKKISPFKIRTRGLGLKIGYDYDNIAELMEQFEGPQYK